MQKFDQPAPIGFYVYRLIDPRVGQPFYVGKGKGRRAWQHERDVAQGRVCNERKSARIREILGCGLRVTVEIVECYDLEEDAYEHEVELIASTAGLLNVLPGGGTPVVLSAAEIQRRMWARQQRIADRRKRQKAERHKAILKRRNRFFEVPGAERHRDKIEAWLAGLKTPKGVVTKEPVDFWMRGGVRPSRYLGRRRKAAEANNGN